MNWLLISGNFTNMYKQKYLCNLWRPIWYCHNYISTKNHPSSSEIHLSLKSSLLAVNSLTNSLLSYFEDLDHNYTFTDDVCIDSKDLNNVSPTESKSMIHNDTVALVLITIRSLSISCDYLFSQEQSTNLSLLTPSHESISQIKCLKGIFGEKIVTNPINNLIDIEENWQINYHTKLLQDCLNTLEAILKENYHEKKQINTKINFLELFVNHINTLVPKLLKVSHTLTITFHTIFTDYIIYKFK